MSNTEYTPLIKGDVPPPSSREISESERLWRPQYEERMANGQEPTEEDRWMQRNIAISIKNHQEEKHHQQKCWEPLHCTAVLAVMFVVLVVFFIVASIQQT